MKPGYSKLEVFLAPSFQGEYTYTTLDDATVVCVVPRPIEAIAGTILAHWADPDAIWELYTPNFQRSEEPRHFSGWSFQGSAWSRALFWGKERNAFRSLDLQRLSQAFINLGGVRGAGRELAMSSALGSVRHHGHEGVIASRYPKVMCLMRATYERPGRGCMVLFNLRRQKYGKYGLVKLYGHCLLSSMHKESESRTREAKSCYGTSEFVRRYISCVFTAQILLVCGRGSCKSLSLLPLRQIIYKVPVY